MLLHLEKGSIRPDSSIGADEGVKEALPAVMTDREPWTRMQQRINRESFHTRMGVPNEREMKKEQQYVFEEQWRVLTAEETNG